MKTILSSFLLLSFTITNAQESTLKKIKDLYYKANTENYQSHTINLNTMQAAIGLQTTKIDFYYDSDQADPEESPYKLNYHVVKVVVNYNISASMDYKIEYLFDKNENLVFCFKKVEGVWENSSLRYYLDKNKLIKVISKSANEKGENKDYTSTKSFKQKDVNFAKQYIKNSEKYLAFFNEIIIVESIDK